MSEVEIGTGRVGGGDAGSPSAAAAPAAVCGPQLSPRALRQLAAVTDAAGRIKDGEAPEWETLALIAAWVHELRRWPPPSGASQ